MNFPRLRNLAALAVSVALLPALSIANPITTDLFFTTFAGGTNVWRVNSSYDGVIHTLGAPVAIGATAGADGIAGNPQNADLLITGGQGPSINTISRTTGIATAVASPVSVFHLEVTGPNTIFGSGIPGALARHTINPGGSIGAGTMIPVAGSAGAITQLISTPTGFYYTSSGPGGNGQFGTLTFDTGIATTATSAVASVLIATLPAAHGGVYDPFTNSIFLGGDDHLTQVDLFGGILGDLTVSGMNFDQGTVDGAGHLYWASNTGHLQFIDYSATGLVDSALNFYDNQFLMGALDDIAPLVGEGSTTPMPEPPMLLLMGIGLLLMAGRKRRQLSA